MDGIMDTPQNPTHSSSMRQVKSRGGGDEKLNKKLLYVALRVYNMIIYEQSDLRRSCSVSSLAGCQSFLFAGSIHLFLLSLELEKR